MVTTGRVLILGTMKNKRYIRPGGPSLRGLVWLAWRVPWPLRKNQASDGEKAAIVSDS